MMFLPHPYQLRVYYPRNTKNGILSPFHIVGYKLISSLIPEDISNKHLLAGIQILSVMYASMYILYCIVCIHHYRKNQNKY